MGEIVIRSLDGMDEYSAAEELQRETWAMSDLDVIPRHALHALQHNGAALLGAFNGDALVGFALGVLGTVDIPGRVDEVAAARLKMYSVIAGVLPEYQHHDVGYRLKMAQRDFALNIGIRLITWTFDPLESRNAYFNIGKLGAVCHRYLRNYHGELSGLNQGLPTDRFEVDWWVTGRRVAARAAQKWRPLALDALLAGGAFLVNEAVMDGEGFPAPPLNYVSEPSNLMLVEVPADFQAVKRHDLALAQRWRMHTRDVFEAMFHSGFMVTDFVSQTDAGGRQRAYYLLTHQDS